MLGGILSGNQECAGKIIKDKSNKYMLFYGMSLIFSMKRYEGNIAGYRVSEGKTIKIPSLRHIKNTIRDILRGLRSLCTYIG